MKVRQREQLLLIFKIRKKMKRFHINLIIAIRSEAQVFA